MAQRSIEETFCAIAPRRRGAQSAMPTSGIESAAGGASLSPALAEASQEIARLRDVYQKQADLIIANTTALHSNQAGGHSTPAVAGSAASHIFGGGLGLLSPVVSGLLSVFRGPSATPAALPMYTPPPPIGIDATLRGTAQTSSTSSGAPVSPLAAPVQPNYAPQITVNVSAMDSQSFMDRSTDIANAVREAMLNNHPINRVVSDL